MQYELKKKNVTQIVKLNKTMKKLEIEELRFCIDDEKLDEIEVYITRYNEYADKTEVVVVITDNEYRIVDVYELVDGVLEYEFTEKDKV